MTSKADWDGADVTLGRVFETVPESTVMDAFSSVSSFIDWCSCTLGVLVNGADTE